MYESRSKPLLSRIEFFFRVLRHSLFAGGLALLALGIGILGYHIFEGLPWIDALLNASMILGGMGPVNPLRPPAASCLLRRMPSFPASSSSASWPCCWR